MYQNDVEIQLKHLSIKTIVKSTSCNKERTTNSDMQYFVNAEFPFLSLQIGKLNAGLIFSFSLVYFALISPARLTACHTAVYRRATHTSTSHKVQQTQENVRYQGKSGYALYAPTQACNSHYNHSTAMTEPQRDASYPINLFLSILYTYT
jgi:hypothetical protein